MRSALCFFTNFGLPACIVYESLARSSPRDAFADLPLPNSRFLVSCRRGSQRERFSPHRCSGLLWTGYRWDTLLFVCFPDSNSVLPILRGTLPPAFATGLLRNPRLLLLFLLPIFPGEAFFARSLVSAATLASVAGSSCCRATATAPRLESGSCARHVLPHRGGFSLPAYLLKMSKLIHFEKNGNRCQPRHRYWDIGSLPPPRAPALG